MTGDALFVRTPYVEGLLGDLPGAGLTGVQVAADVVRIVSPLPDEDPADLEFELGWHADKLGLTGMRVAPRHTFQEVILWCGHDWSLTGAEGPVAELRRRGRPWPLLWSCDTCGATVLDLGEGWVPMPMWRGARP